MNKFQYFSDSASSNWEEEGYESEEKYIQDLIGFETTKKLPTRADFSSYRFEVTSDSNGKKRVTQVKSSYSGAPIPMIEEGHEVDSIWVYPRQEM